MSEYLVRNGEGKWEICRAGVFLIGPKEGQDGKYIVAWADRNGAFFCSNEDVVETQSLPE